MKDFAEGQSLSRRNFLTGAGIAAAGIAAGALAGCSTEGGQGLSQTGADEWWLPERWDDEADLIVVGYGASGAFASMTAVNEGASVIVLEKSPYREGGDMACSGGGIHDCPGCDPEEWYDCYVHGAYGAAAPREVMMPYMEEAADMPNWIGDYGIEIVWRDFSGDGRFLPTDNVSGTVSPEKYDGTLGNYLFEEVDAAVSDHDVDIRLATPAKRLIQNPRTREIIGVQAEDADGNTLYFKANKAVILACGGFGANNDMFQNYFQPGPHVVTCSTPYNTGDGITMALAVGADLWHMNNTPEYGGFTFLQPSLELGMSLFSPPPAEGIIVDCNGKRFMNESYIESHDMNHRPALDYSCQSVFTHKANDPAAKLYTERTDDFLHLPMFVVMDQATYDKHNPLFSLKFGRGYLYAHHMLFPDEPLPLKWDDNQDAIDQGWLFKGDTIEDLAANIHALRPCQGEEDAIDGLDAEVLRATIEQYNSYCAAGEDPDFLRDPETMVPLGDGPYYAIEVGIQTVVTQGGPKRNGYSQTIDSFGEPIPRLYNTGSLGSYNVWAYNVGELVQAFTTGRMAARHAAALDPWDGVAES